MFVNAWIWCDISSNCFQMCGFRFWFCAYIIVYYARGRGGFITVHHVYYAVGRGGLLPTPGGGSPATPGGLHRQLSRLNSRDSGLKKGREVPYEVVIDGKWAMLYVCMYVVVVKKRLCSSNVGYGGCMINYILLWWLLSCSAKCGILIYAIFVKLRIVLLLLLLSDLQFINFIL